MEGWEWRRVKGEGEGDGVREDWDDYKEEEDGSEMMEIIICS